MLRKMDLTPTPPLKQGREKLTTDFENGFNGLVKEYQGVQLVQVLKTAQGRSPGTSYTDLLHLEEGQGIEF